MSVRSKKRRRARRKAERAAWAAIGRNGALVAPDVYEALRAKAGPVKVIEFPGTLATLSGITIEVCPWLRPGTVIAKPPPFRLDAGYLLSGPC